MIEKNSNDTNKNALKVNYKLNINTASIKSTHAMNTWLFHIFINQRTFHFNCRFRRK